MAIYHFSIKTISRSSGRTATASSAYRAGEKITDYKTGEIHNYTRKKGVISKGLVLPNQTPEWANNREQLWNKAEASEKRINSTVAREFEVALPSELSAEGREQLVKDFSKAISKRHGCGIDWAIHEPNKEGDQRNYHAHILLTTRRLSPEGFTEKTRELDDRKTGETEVWRKSWADYVNQALNKEHINDQVTHLSLKDQGIINREPTRHQGAAATATERRARNKYLNEDKPLIQRYKELQTSLPQKTREPVAIQSLWADKIPLSSEALLLSITTSKLSKVEYELEQLLSEKAKQEKINQYKEALKTLTPSQLEPLKIIEKGVLKIVNQMEEDKKEEALFNFMENITEKIHTNQLEPLLSKAKIETQKTEPSIKDNELDMDFGR